MKKIYALMALSLTSTLALAAPVELVGKSCSINTYSATCNVQTGCFDTDSFSNATKQAFEKQIKASGFELIKDRHHRDYYNPEFMIELKYNSRKENLGLRVYGKLPDGRVGSVFYMEQAMKNGADKDALELIQQMPVCKLKRGL